ncbi:hypothetical protein F2Q69_00011763 [Brassica cretica]|uniref:Uncharacterized protein n=1 Tax=Brassica cretica TaxID=69181 RepID=A0A8S9QVY5_BRACR|nr:hypothetical protein F2Q69_00011763 [Brassica cretica]
MWTMISNLPNDMVVAIMSRAYGDYGLEYVFDREKVDQTQIFLSSERMGHVQLRSRVQG